jgi:integrase
MMEKLYDFNHQAELWEVRNCVPSSRNAGSWGGPLHRRLIQAIYTISYLCLLRIDEVLKIRREHIKFEDDGKVTLTLPFRKTHQFGGRYLTNWITQTTAHLFLLVDIKPFVLYPLGPEETYLCPVRALADWIYTSKITSGFLFRQLAAGRPAERDSAVVGFLPSSFKSSSLYSSF